MNYEDFNEETKTFINKAMEIYSAILDKKIHYEIFEIGRRDYEVTKLDKRVIALFIAGLLVDGNLKKIFSRYDDIKLDDLLEFVHISKSDIKPLENGEYEEFYNDNFKLDIMTFIRRGLSFNTVNVITPEVIVKSLHFHLDLGSDILEHFAKQHNIYGGALGFGDHPIFKAVDNFCVLNGFISDKSRDQNKVESSSPLFEPSPSEIGIPQPLTQTQGKQEVKKINERVWQKLDAIKKKFIGQESIVEELFYNIVNNQQLATMRDVPDGQRSIIFIDGPTGTGKTAITREITESLGVPFTSTSLTNYSAEGYKGGDITDILKDLLKKAGGNIEKAQRGIVVLDEFDKIAYSRGEGLEMKKAVQQQLLDFMGGGKYTIRIGESIFDMREVEFDTSKLTFVCLGALTDLRTKKTETVQPLGFIQEEQTTKAEDSYNITPQDLINIGLERELVGRFNTYLHTDDYSIETLERILRESTISPFIAFKSWVESLGKKLVIDDEDKVFSIIAECAYQLNTGARSLQTVMNNIRTPLIKDVLRGQDEEIHLDSEKIRETMDNMTNRKRRG